MQISGLDHLVLTVRDIPASLEFYRTVMGLTEVTFGSGRKGLIAGDQKINLHKAGNEFEPKADRPTPGSADLCFITETSMDDVLAELASADVAVIQGPVRRTGALGPILSVYFRDPDLNLIEVSTYEIP